MRKMAVLLMLLLTSPAMADFWSHYANPSYGYEIDIPPGFEGNGENAESDGQWFHHLAAEQGLTVWGARFSGEFGDALDQSAPEGWALTDQVQTEEWATLAAVRADRMMVQRAIVLCDRQSYAAFRAEFNTNELGRMEAVLGGLARSLMPIGC